MEGRTANSQLNFFHEKNANHFLKKQKDVSNEIYRQNSCNHITSKHRELETSMCLKRSFATHYITGNLMHPISNLSVTLDNVCYYIILSGTCDFSEPALCKLQLFFCSVSQAGAGFKMHVRFATTLGKQSLAGELTRMTKTHSLVAVFYTLMWKALTTQFKKPQHEQKSL